MGQVSQTLDGTQCTKWGDVKVNQSDAHFRAASSIMFMLETSADDYFKLQATHWHNTSSCHGASRSDVHGAQCYDGSAMSLCDVPYCACATGWFQCPTGQCLPNRMSVDDCLDTRGIGWAKHNDVTRLTSAVLTQIQRLTIRYMNYTSLQLT
jgi:hypothetical protein